MLTFVTRASVWNANHVDVKAKAVSTHVFLSERKGEKERKTKREERRGAPLTKHS